MDVLDFADSHFLHYHFPDDLRYACLGIGVAYHRTPGFSDDSDHARYAVLFGVVRQCLHPSRMAWAYGLSTVDRLFFCGWLGNCRYALGVIVIENFRLNIETTSPEILFLCFLRLFAAISNFNSARPG
jgi:hypothetical protein